MAEEPLAPDSPLPEPQPAKDQTTPPPLPSNSSTPQVGPVKRNKIPLPLLSRRKMKPPRDLTSKELPQIETITAKPRKTRWTDSLWAKILFRLLAYAAIIGLGYVAYHQFRQTQVLGAISAPGYGFSPEIYLVRDFSDDLKTLRQEYIYARSPNLSELKTRQDSLIQIQSDLAGLQERERLLQQGVDASKEETASVIKEATDDQDKIWQNNVKPMDDEYNQKLTTLEAALKDRALKLGLTYQYDESLRSPEVWVNAFRLALYNPPKEVKVNDERQWAEDQLKLWSDFEKSQDDKRQSLRQQVDDIRKAIPAKLEEIDARKKHLESRIAETEDEAKPIREELDVVTGQAEQVKKLLDDQTTKYYAQLFDIPIHNILDKIPLSKDGTWSLPQPDQSSKYPPGGNYLLWITLKKGGEDYWALVPFSPIQYETLEVLISDKAFIRAHSVLE